MNNNNNSNQLTGSQGKGGAPNDRSLAQESKEAYESYGNTGTLRKGGIASNSET